MNIGPHDRKTRWESGPLANSDSAGRGPQPPGAPAIPRTRQLAKEGAPKFERKLWRESSRQDKYHSPETHFFRPSRIQTRDQISEIFEAARKRKSRREIRSEVERSRWRTWGASRGWAGSSSAPSGNAAALLRSLPLFLSWRIGLESSSSSSFCDWNPLLLFVYLTARDLLMRFAICCCTS